MKRLSLFTVLILSFTSFANAEYGEICGFLNPNEGCLSDSNTEKPRGVCLSDWQSSKTAFAYFLVAKSKTQKANLASLATGEEYCVQGELFWCGKGDNYKCLTVDSVR